MQLSAVSKYILGGKEVPTNVHFLHCVLYIFRCANGNWKASCGKPATSFRTSFSRSWIVTSKANCNLQSMASSRPSGVFGFFSIGINHFDKWLFHEIELLNIMQAPLVYVETNGWKCLQCIIIHLTIVSRAEPGCWVVSRELCWAHLEVRMMKQSQIPGMIERMLGSRSLKVKQQTGLSNLDGLVELEWRRRSLWWLLLEDSCHSV